MRTRVLLLLCFASTGCTRRVKLQSKSSKPTSLSTDLLFETVSGDWDVQAPKQKVWGHRVLKKGDRIAIWCRNGNMKTVDGPCSKWFFGSTIQPLRRFVAGPAEFICVLRKDGTREVLRGPTYVWHDPIEHQSVNVYRAININKNEALVVYREAEGQVSRIIVQGPTIFIPQSANEWIQQFVWHGSDPDSRHHGIHRKVRGGLCFTKLRVMPDQLDFDVENVRTKDDALLMVRTMIFFQLENIEQMLDNTHDVISEFINAISADIVEKASILSFDEFRAAAGELNTLEAYPQLMQKAKSIGYSISNVVFRGYEASDALQSMHDRSIETRTKLRLETEREEQEQELKHFKLSQELERELKVREEEERVVQHTAKMEALKLTASLRESREIEEQKLLLQQKADGHMLEAKAKQMKVLEDHYAALERMGVNLNTHLAERPNHIVRFEHGQSSEANAEGHSIDVQYHMHDPGSSDQ